MKNLRLILLLALASFGAAARDGYCIHIKMPDVHDTIIFLAHYYGMSGSKVYISDSANLRHGCAVFESKDPDFVGGIYIVLVGKDNFELLLNRGDDFALVTRKQDIPDGITFKNSPENERFLKYKQFSADYAGKLKKLEAGMKQAKTPADTDRIRKRATELSKGRVQYMHEYVKQYPGTLLAAIFSAMETPEVPAGAHLLPDGVTNDSTFAYRYYKQHFWDGFNFRDDRLIYAPIFDGKIEEYMTKLVLPWHDSVNKEAEWLLSKARGSKDVFHYVLHWLTYYAESSKVMGMDESFVYLVENYYMKGDAVWLSHEQLQKYIDRAMAMAPNVIGNVAPEIRLPNIFTGREETLDKIHANYTLVVFYSPSCGHCQHELPRIDSIYEAALKQKGVSVLTVATEGSEKEIRDFLTKLKVDKKWINTQDVKHNTDCRNKYDVYSTPTIYLLDEKKVIRGKRIDHGNLLQVIEGVEKMRLSKT